LSAKYAHAHTLPMHMRVHMHTRVYGRRMGITPVSGTFFEFQELSRNS